MKNRFLLALIILIPFIVNAQGIVNNGGVIKITRTGLNWGYVYINNGGYTNATSGTNHGTIDNDGTITLTGNWTNNATAAANKVFTNLDNEGDVVIIGGNTTIAGVNPTNFENLTINKTLSTNTVQLTNTETNGYTTVGNGTQGALTLTRGILTLNSRTMVINNTSTAALTYTANSYVVSETYDNGSGTGSPTPQNPCNSKIRWNIGTSTGNYIFPFSTAAGTTVRFQYNVTGAGTGAGNVTVSTYHTNNANYPYPTDGSYPVLHMAGYFVADNSSNALDRFHIATVSGYTTKPTASITFYYDETNDLNGITEADLQAQNWVWVDATHGYWSNLPVGTVNAANNYISGIPSNNSNQTNIWVGSNNRNPLPIELIGFDGKCNGNETMLYWSTASETNNDYFTVEKSTDLDKWEIVTIVKGAGNSNVLLNYSAYDYSPSFNIPDYYRLKQTDFNGKYTYSDVISVKCDGNSGDITINNVYQQGNYLIFTCNNPDGLPYNIDLFDLTGRKVISTKHTPENTGYNQMKLDISGLTIGCYMVYIHNASSNLSQKVIISNY